jgi:hypothetical protein
MPMAERDSRQIRGDTLAEVEEDAMRKLILIALLSEAAVLPPRPPRQWDESSWQRTDQDSAGTGGEAKCREILNALVRERQTLRLQAADAIALEANRLAIEYWRQRVLAEQGELASG